LVTTRQSAPLAPSAPPAQPASAAADGDFDEQALLDQFPDPFDS
jgi:hypothetical protein